MFIFNVLLFSCKKDIILNNFYLGNFILKLVRHYYYFVYKSNEEKNEPAYVLCTLISILHPHKLFILKRIKFKTANYFDLALIHSNIVDFDNKITLVYLKSTYLYLGLSPSGLSLKLDSL